MSTYTCTVTLIFRSSKRRYIDIYVRALNGLGRVIYLLLGTWPESCWELQQFSGSLLRMERIWLYLLHCSDRIQTKPPAWGMSKWYSPFTCDPPQYYSFVFNQDNLATVWFKAARFLLWIKRVAKDSEEMYIFN